MSELHVHIKKGEAETLYFHGTLLDTLTDIGYLLQQIHRAIPHPKARELFRIGVEALAVDPGSPVWKDGEPDGVVDAATLDLAELARQAGEEASP